MRSKMEKIKEYKPMFKESGRFNVELNNLKYKMNYIKSLDKNLDKLDKMKSVDGIFYNKPVNRIEVTLVPMLDEESEYKLKSQINGLFPEYKFDSEEYSGDQKILYFVKR
jgi:hypothetical protein